MSDKYNGKICDLNLINGKIVKDNEIIDAGISIREGKIVKISKEPNIFKADRTINLKNKIILPGMIDLHVHCRDLELSYKEDFYSATAAAIHGGVTTILDMPNTNPPSISVEILNKRKKMAEKKILCNIGFYSGLPNDLEKVKELSKCGIFGIKLLLNNPMNAYEYHNKQILREIFNQCSKYGIKILVHPEFHSFIKKQNKDNKQKNTIQNFLEKHNEKNEYLTIKKILKYCQDIDCHLHFCHLSTSKDIDLISKFKQNKEHKLKISSEVTPHHLFLTQKMVFEKDSLAKMLPPLRKKNNQKSLLEALKIGIIDVIATDHAPHSLDEKKQAFPDAPSGIPNLETTLPILLTQVNKDIMSIFEVCKFYSRIPARLFNLSNKGRVSEKFDADLVIIDPKAEYKINSSDFFSKAKFSPFDGLKCSGKPFMTIVQGEIKMKEDEVVAEKGSGKILLN
ncbi:MAG: amidohydrolase family protein [Candidatus Lokiarchaeota archaeon]|nr:amidohydrolase family protein [Candidatus Lokiarchaeota archaeon]